MSTIRNYKMLAVIAKLEPTYGLDSSPTAALNAIQTRNAKISVLEGDSEELNIDSPQLGNQLLFRATNYTKLEFEVLLAGSGTVDVAPSFGVLLRACGLKETITPATSVDYQPISSGYESVSLYFMQDRIQHKLLGARGNVSFVLSPGKAPIMKFSFIGLAVAATEVVMPTDFDTSGFLIPTPVTDSNTPTFSINSVDLPMHEFTFDIAQDVSYLNVVNQEVVRITDRKPKGQNTIAEPLLSEINFYDISEKMTVVPLAYTHGTVAGEIIDLSLPKIQIEKPSTTELNGTAGLQMPFRAIPNLGDDDFILTFK